MEAKFNGTKIANLHSLVGLRLSSVLIIDSRKINGSVAKPSSLVSSAGFSGLTLESSLLASDLLFLESIG